MKVLILVLAVAGIASAATFRGAGHEQRLKLLKQSLGQAVVKALLPPLPKDVAFNNTDLKFESYLIDVDGRYENGHLYGLDTFTDNLILNLLTLVVTGNVNITSARVVGDYSGQAQLRINEGTYDLKGAGKIDVTVNKIQAKGIRIKVNVNLITQKVSFASIEMTPSFTSTSGGATGATANGEPIDWDAVAKEVPSVFDKNWANRGSQILEDVRGAVNEIVKDLTLEDLLDLILGPNRP